MIDLKQRVIIGLDPGTTTALAFLSLKGRVLQLVSERHFPSEDIIETILEEFKPVLISTDKAKTPSLVEEISSNLDTQLFTPEEDLSIERKKDLTEDHQTDNPHERDALASALYAYHSYENKLRNIEVKMDELNLTDMMPEAKELVIKGKVNNVSEAIEEIMGDEEEEKTMVERKDEVSEEDIEEKVERMRNTILEERRDKERLEDYVDTLEQRVDELEGEKNKLEKDVEDFKEGKRDAVIEREEIQKRERKLRSKRNENRDLKKENKGLSNTIERLKKFEEMRKEDKIPIRTVEVNKEDIIKEDGFLDLENEVVMFEDPVENEKILDILDEKNVKGIIGKFSKEFRDETVSRGIVVIPEDSEKLNFEGSVPFIEREVLEKADKVDRKNFLEWIKKYRKRGKN